jgi:hypothetical protein
VAYEEVSVLCRGDSGCGGEVPSYKTSTKVIVTAIVIAGTAVLCYISVRLYTMLLEPFETMTGGKI